jgi:hypothetical protein
MSAPDGWRTFGQHREVNCVGQHVDPEKMELEGPSLSIALLAALDEAPLPTSRDELYTLTRTEAAALEGRVETALRAMGTLVVEKQPVEDRPSALELRIGRWQFSAQDATIRTLRFIGAEAAALIAAGLSTPTVLVAVVGLILALPDLLAAQKLSDEELKLVLALEARGPSTSADLASIIRVPVAQIQAVLDRLANKSVVSEDQGTYATRL